MKFNSKLLQGCILSAGMIVTAMASASAETAKGTDVQETRLVGEKDADVWDALVNLSDIASRETAKQAVSRAQEKEVAADVQANETVKVMAAETEETKETKETKETEEIEEIKAASITEPTLSVAAQAGAVVAEEARAAKEAQKNVDSVQPEPEAQEAVALQETAADQSGEDEWAAQVMPVVEESLNVRTQPDENSDLAGKLYKGCAAQVVEVLDGWTHIVSGDVEGYVSNEYCAYGAEAQALAEEQCTTYATVLTDGLRVRSEASVDSSISTVADEGEKLEVNTEAEAPEGWVAVDVDDELCYVSAEFVGVEMEIGEAITIEEEMARIAEEEARKAEEAAAAAAESAKTQPVQNAAVAASADETTLLAAIIQIEAGSTNYDGQVAVGAVVMNRVRSGSYPNSISGVIYQSGQFATGSMNSVIANGVSSSCYSAAQAAIGGADNTGGALSFRSASSGYAGTIIGGNVFF